MDTSKIITIIILVAIFLLGGAIMKFIKRIKSNIKRTVQRKIDGAIRDVVGLTSNDIYQLADALKEEKTVTPKSISGATSMYLNRITTDFPDFHYNDAETAVKKFITEYIGIVFEGKNNFEKSKVDESILAMIEKQSNKDVKNIIFNKIAVSGYNKSDEYATITFQASVGFDLNAQRYETRYTIEYTLRLATNNVASKVMKCPNCGATIEDTKLTNCEYCDAKIIKDTIFNWLFTSITEK